MTGDSKSRNFLNTVQDCFISQLIDFPTHKASTQPDLFLTDCLGLVNEVCSLGNIGSNDHCAILSSINVQFDKSESRTQIRNWYRGDYDSINYELNDVNWLQTSNI